MLAPIFWDRLFCVIPLKLRIFNHGLCIAFNSLSAACGSSLN